MFKVMFTLHVNVFFFTRINKLAKNKQHSNVYSHAIRSFLIQSFGLLSDVVWASISGYSGFQSSPLKSCI